MQASWAVQYRDGTWMFQYDADGQEVPYRAIDWAQVVHLQFESQHAVESFDIGTPPLGYQLSLRSRHFRTLHDQDGMCFMIVLSAVGLPVDEDSVADVLYWFPNGVSHQCYHFNCPDIHAYGAAVIRDEASTLMPQHRRQQIQLSGAVTP